jgi:ribosome recycling factor
MIAEVIEDAEDRMKKSIEALARELSAIRTGHARPALVDHVKVEYYGTETPLNQMATVAAPEARLLTIQPWDRSALGAIEKALLKSDLGLTPSNDGAIIRLAIPALTEQRRKDLTKIVHTRTEDGRIAIRNVRRDASDKLKRMTVAKEIGEDEQHKALDQVQKLTDKYIATVDQRGKDKEAELMEV